MDGGYGLGFGVWGLGFLGFGMWGFWGLGIGVWGLGFGVWGAKVQGWRHRIQGPWTLCPSPEPREVPLFPSSYFNGCMLQKDTTASTHHDTKTPTHPKP